MKNQALQKKEDIKMKELNLRKWHRNLGIILAFFIILQAGSGLLLSLGEIDKLHSHEHSESTAGPGHHEEGNTMWADLLAFMHHGGGTVGIAYRLLLGLGLLGLTISGGMIFIKVRARATASHG